MKRRRVLFFFGVLCAVSASAQTTIDHWRFGENDSGASNGGAVNTATIAAVGSNLTEVGALTYSSNTPGSASALSISFPSGANYFTGSLLGVNNNYAIEAWFNTSTLSSTHVIAYNGNTSSSGLGIYQNGATVNFLAGGAIVGGNVSITTGTWIHVAAVRDNGTNRFFVNGSEYGVGGNGYSTAAGAFYVGANQVSTESFSGLIDDVRVITFTGGAFSVSMLNYPASAIPEPASWAALTGLGALALATIRRRPRA